MLRSAGFPLPVYPSATSDVLSCDPSLIARSPAAKLGVHLEAGNYIARLALSEADRRAAFRLRFQVFNIELGEGLASSYNTEMDIDLFDEVCDHLLVEDRRTGEILGTYRMQMGDVAARNYGYYSALEFDLSPFESRRDGIVELGRACIHRDHRCPEVLNLLWRGIARYALANGGRYMVGCCSLTSQDPEMGHAVYRALGSYMIEPDLRTRPTPAYAMPPSAGQPVEAIVPKLLRAYLTIGARICGEPAIDRDFGTIDFLTLVDLQTLHPRMAARFLDAR